MSDRTPTTFVELAAEQAVLRKAIVELGLAQAEALNALAEFLTTGLARNVAAVAVSSAAGNTLAVIAKLADLDGGR